MTLDEAFALERSLYNHAEVAAVGNDIFDSNSAMDLVTVTTVRMLMKLRELPEGEPLEAVISPSLILVMAVAYMAGARVREAVGLPKEVTQ
jgi:hypothetical protein